MDWRSFIFEGSPFVPELRQIDIQLLIMQARVDTQPWQLQIALRLADPEGQFAGCLRNLSSNISSFAEFGLSEDKLTSYKLGYLAPFLTIRMSCEEETDLILSILARKWDFDGEYISFIKKNLPKCKELIKRNAHDSEYFYLTSMYLVGDPEYYSIGIGVAKLLFSECWFYLDKYLES